MKPLKVALIGLGKQNLEDHLPAVLTSKNVELDSVCDIDTEKLNDFNLNYQVPVFSKLEDLVKDRKIDFAIVAVPHNVYLGIIKILSENKISILKEKPFAMNIDEACNIHKYIKENNIKMLITLQRRFNPIYQTFLQLVKHIGTVYHIDGRYTLNIKNL